MNQLTLEITTLRRELQEITESFQRKKRDLHILLDEKLPMEERTKEIELMTAYEVSVESDESGKKAYSNEIFRNAEIKKGLKNHLEYGTLKEQLDFLEKQERTLKTEIEILDRRFHIIEQLVVLVMVEGHLIKPYCQEVSDHERDN